jgi:RNA-binding protein 5/10
MFFEERSDFFYDPKARLYYGAKKKAYFRYDDSQVPPFVETERVDAAQGTPLEPVAPLLLLPPTSGATGEKHKIVINLKTKKTKKPQTSTAAEGASSFPIIQTKVQKTQVENIEKWQIKQAELKAESSVPVVPIITEIQRTANGEPICVICQRKFPTVDKFRLHEAKSEMHKSNLAKQEGQQASQTTGADDKKGELEHLPAAQQYNNRAEKRRFLHGSSYPEPFQSKVVGSDMVLDAPQGDSLGETNIGNKLLQSMGWQTGAALGGRTSNDDQNTKSSGDIRKEWDRIEAIAAKKRGPDF